MTLIFRSVYIEFLKNRRSKFTWITFAAFSLAPLMGGLFMYLIKTGSITGAFSAKAELMDIQANWNSMLAVLSQAMGVGGILIFGFAAGWLFGREYAEGTVKDLIALPVSRSTIVNSKFLYFALWCIALAVWDLLIGLIIGALLGLPGWSAGVFTYNLKIYVNTSIMTLMLSTPVALFALAGRGYLAPLGFVVILLVLAQILGALGAGLYFPWSVPGIYSGSAGEMKLMLDNMSYSAVFFTGLSGYILTILYFNFADQKK